MSWVQSQEIVKCTVGKWLLCQKACLFHKSLWLQCLSILSHHILDRESIWSILLNAVVCLVHIWPASDKWGMRSYLDPSALIYLWNNLLSFFPFQIQFKEKVLWTAITLFIFLVCCQVSSVLVLVGVTGLRTPVWYLLSPVSRFPCLASCLQTQLTLSTGCEWF